MSKFLSILLPLSLLAGLAMADETAPAPEVMKRYACSVCHQPATRAVGPSWQEVAERYRDGSESAEQLAARIKHGSSGRWGGIPMPPQLQANDADLALITHWILEAH